MDRRIDGATWICGSVAITNLYSTVAMPVIDVIGEDVVLVLLNLLQQRIDVQKVSLCLAAAVGQRSISVNTRSF